MFWEGFSFGMFALGLLFSFIVICLSVFVAKEFWRFFKRFARFEIKVQTKDYTKEAVAEKIAQNKKELKNLELLQKKGAL